MLGVIALAAAGTDPGNVSGAIMLGQGMLIQEQINFTRMQEHEADHVGVEMLARAGFDPNGMVHFFETMQRVQRYNNRIPEFLSTHPLSLSRMTEAAQRVQAMGSSLRPSSVMGLCRKSRVQIVASGTRDASHGFVA
jgi:predicted Zn-dependent protease